MWDEAANGIPFGVLCEMLATYDDPDGAAARGAGYLHGWITAGILTAFPPAHKEGARRMGTDTDRHFIERMTLGRSRAAHRRRRGGDIADRRRGQAARLPPPPQYRPHPGRMARGQDGRTDRRADLADADLRPLPGLRRICRQQQPVGFDLRGAWCTRSRRQILGSGCRKLLVLNTGISTLAPVERALARLDAERVMHLRIHEGPRYPPRRRSSWPSRAMAAMPTNSRPR